MSHNFKLFLFEPTYLAVAPKPSRTAHLPHRHRPRFAGCAETTIWAATVAPRPSAGPCRYPKPLYYNRDSGSASGYTAGFGLRREAGRLQRAVAPLRRSGADGIPYLVSCVMLLVGIGALLIAIPY